MIKWIHVVTASKLPIVRGGQSSVYETYDDAFDPNVGTPFGPDKETMFLPVVGQDQPTFNAVTHYAQYVQTLGADGVTPYNGEYDDPVWLESWEILENTVERARELKIALMEVDRDAFVADGYVVGPFTFPLTEHFFRLLADRLRWLSDATEELAVPPNTQLTFSDLKDSKVPVGLNTLKSHFIAFGIEYLGMYETEVDARDAIKAATTVVEVDAVAWSF